MGASIRPSEHVGELQPLNINDKKLMGSIHEHSLDWLVQNYVAPPSDPNGYFDIRGVPVAWDACVSKFPVKHLFLYSFCLASNDPNLSSWRNAREQAIAVCSDLGDELKEFWLHNRPQYGFQALISNMRRHYPAWSWDIRTKFSGLAREYGVSGKVIFVIYSSKAMLSSKTDIGGWRHILDVDIKGWDNWVISENDKIRKFFNIGTK